MFECAMCEAANAATQATTAGSAGNASAVTAHLVGSNASVPLRRRVRRALSLVARDGSRPPSRQGDLRYLVAPDAGEPNLVVNLAEVIRGTAGGPRAFVPAVRVMGQADGSMAYDARLAEAGPAGPVPPGAVSIDVIGGSVREAFLGHRLLEPTPEAVSIAAGSLLLGYSLAEQTIAASRAESPFGWPERAYDFPPPWQVSHPVLLDPVMWMIGTAYVLAGREPDSDFGGGA